MVQTNNANKIVKFQVVQEGKSLLGCEDSKDLQLVSFHMEQVQVNNDDDLRGNTKEEIIPKYAECFGGLGCIAEPYHIKIDKDAEPVVHHLQKKTSSSKRETKK